MLLHNGIGLGPAEGRQRRAGTATQRHRRRAQAHLVRMMTSRVHDLGSGSVGWRREHEYRDETKGAGLWFV